MYAIGIIIILRNKIIIKDYQLICIKSHDNNSHVTEHGRDGCEESTLASAFLHTQEYTYYETVY